MMVGEDDNIFRLWRLRTMALQVSLRILRPKQNVLFQMCYDRGFTVSHEELNQPLSAFVSVYGDRPLRRDLTVLVPSSDDPTGESNVKHLVTPAQLLCGSGALMQKPQHQLRLTAVFSENVRVLPGRATGDGGRHQRVQGTHARAERPQGDSHRAIRVDIPGQGRKQYSHGSSCYNAFYRRYRT